VTLLNEDRSTRTPKTLEWLIHSIRSIYDEKTLDDRSANDEKQPIVPLPEYLLIWAMRQYGRDHLATKGCWDVFITSHYYMQRSSDVGMFVRFLDEQLTLEQLCFFLRARAWIVQRCVSVPVDSPDLGFYIAETYMTASQVDDFFHTIFSRTEKELIDDLTVRAWACVDAGRLKDNDPANIPMIKMLELAVAEDHDRLVRRLRKMLAFYRPVPRMTPKHFAEFVKSMICNIDPNMINALYRSAIVYNAVRIDMDQQAFIEHFRHTEVEIVPQGWSRESIEPEEFAVLSKIYAAVLARWLQFSPFLTTMLRVLERNENGGALVAEVRFQVFRTLEAMASFDGTGFYQCYHKLLQTVMQACLTLNLPDPATFFKQVTEFEGLLMKRFQTLTAINDLTSPEEGQ
jgi:hypothetical protein